MHDTFNHNYCHGYKLITFVFIVQLQKHHHKLFDRFSWFCGEYTKQPHLNVFYDKCGQHIVDV